MKLLIGILVLMSVGGASADPAVIDCRLETPADVALRFHDAMGVKDFTTVVACLHPDVHASFIGRFRLEPNPQNRERMDAFAVILGAADIDELRKWDPAQVMAAYLQMQVDLGPRTDDRLAEVQYEVLDQRVVSDTEATVILRAVMPPGYPESNLEMPLKKTADGCWRVSDMGQSFR